MTTEGPERAGEELARQREEVLGMLAGAVGATRARRSVRAAGLPDDLAPDVQQEAWLRAVATFDRRSEPYVDLDEVRARVLAHRIVDRVAIDWARGAPRRREVATPHHAEGDGGPALERFDDTAGVTGPPDGLAALGRVDSAELVRALAAAIGRRAATGAIGCRRCDPRVAVAAALHLLAGLDREPAGTALAGGTTWFDRALYAALRHADPDGFPDGPPDAATRQRKHRCGRCVVELLAAACAEVGLR